MLPVYIGYFAGGTDRRETVSGTAALPRGMCFVAGFTAVFCALGVFAGSLGRLLSRYQGAVNLVCGGIVILLGFSFLWDRPLPFLKGIQNRRSVTGPISAFLFGMVYAVNLTPCAGAFLGAALMLASTAGGTVKGGLLLLAYSLGLGVPFLLSAALIGQLKGAFAVVKKNYALLNRISGGFLIAVGIVMAAGWMNRLLGAFAVFA